MYLTGSLKRETDSMEIEILGEDGSFEENISHPIKILQSYKNTEPKNTGALRGLTVTPLRGIVAGEPHATYGALLHLIRSVSAGMHCITQVEYARIERDGKAKRVEMAQVYGRKSDLAYVKAYIEAFFAAFSMLVQHGVTIHKRRAMALEIWAHYVRVNWVGGEEEIRDRMRQNPAHILEAHFLADDAAGDEYFGVYAAVRSPVLAYETLGRGTPVRTGMEIIDTVFEDEGVELE